MSVHDAHVAMPVDLIVANTMHRVWLEMERARRRGDSGSPPAEIQAMTARLLLQSIAVNGDIATVLYCLGEAGAPGSLDMIGEGLQAVADRQAAPPRPTRGPPLTIKPPPASPPEAAS